jgi:hypothetical protein
MSITSLAAWLNAFKTEPAGVAEHHVAGLHLDRRAPESPSVGRSGAPKSRTHRAPARQECARPADKQPYYFTRRDGQPVTIAGLWDTWRDKQAAETIKSAAMVITDANEVIGELHDRMPVILEQDQFEPWLSSAAGVEILTPAADDVLQRWPVSRRVNSSRADDGDASLIHPVTTVQPVSVS